MDILNISLAFIEGLALIASPCILPILPIILSVSVDGSKKRPLGVIVGFVASFTLFTLFSRQLVLWFGLNLNIVRDISFALLLIFGVIMVSSRLTEKFNSWTEGLANFGLRATQNNAQTGFASGVIFGSLVGLIWTPCAGPILAAVIVQAILQQSTLASFFTILAFGLGAAVPMLIIILCGRILLQKLQLLQKSAVLIRKILGITIIIAVLVMMFGSSLYQVQTSTATVKNPAHTSDISGMHLQDGLLQPFPAPDFKDITQWFNSPPLHIQDLRGKVVLVDFWAYSCINCIRTLPYLTNWYNKYQHDGLEIIGVHSPEFNFERDPSNVEAAIKSDGIKYPVALDNQFGTWQNYNNLYWPAHYLIDKQGNVVYEHFGEGDDDVMENNIRYLLGITTKVSASVENVPLMRLTPETYLGFERGEFASNESVAKDVERVYTYPKELSENAWALQGNWNIQKEKIVSAEKNASIKINFTAGKVYAVMAAAQPIHIQIKLNGESVKLDNGEDVKDSTVVVHAAKLYKLLNLKHDKHGILELIVGEPGLEIYTFTFGP